MTEAILVWNPNPTLDLVSEIRSFTAGVVHRAEAQTLSAGGKGTLVLRTLTALGVDCLAATPLAGLSGRFVEELMKEERLPVVISQVAGTTRAAVSIVDRAALIDSVVNGPGPTTGTTEWEAHCQLVADHIDRGRFGTFVVAGRPPLDDGDAGLTALCEHATTAGLRVVLDISEPFLGPALATQPWLVKINQSEAEACGQSKESDEIGKLLGLGARNVVLTDGPGLVRGSLEGVALTATPPAVQLRSAVGCGDCFLGGLLCGLLDDPARPGEAVRLAIAVSAAAAETLKPGGFSISRARELRARVRMTARNAS